MEVKREVLLVQFIKLLILRRRKVDVDYAKTLIAASTDSGYASPCPSGWNESSDWP
jgi:hypothetical protein